MSAEEPTRTEFLGRTIHDALCAARDVRALMPVTDINPDELDVLDARVEIAEAIQALSKAAADLDREVVRLHPGHVRQSPEWVVVSTRKPFEKRTYKGDPHVMVDAVVDRIVEVKGIDEWGERCVDAAQLMADELVKVWTVTKSKLPTMGGLKGLGISPDTHLITDWGDRLKVDVIPVELYESIYGPPPLLEADRMPAHSEPF